MNELQVMSKWGVAVYSMDALFRRARAILAKNIPAITGPDAVIHFAIYCALARSHKFEDYGRIPKAITDFETLFETIGYTGPKINPPDERRNCQLLELLTPWIITDAMHRFDPHDLFGSFYEEMIGKGKANTLGQFFTPRVMAEAIYHLTGSDDHEDFTVIDPACGSGRLLLAFGHLEHAKLIGYDIDERVLLLCKLNFYCWLQYPERLGKIKDLQIKNTLEEIDPRTITTDTVIMNPPFGKCELDFMEWLLAVPGLGSRVAILPTTFLDNQRCKRTKELRRRLLTEFEITHIIKPKNGMFETTNVETVIIFFSRPTEEKRAELLEEPGNEEEIASYILCEDGTFQGSWRPRWQKASEILKTKNYIIESLNLKEEEYYACQGKKRIW